MSSWVSSTIWSSVFTPLQFSTATTTPPFSSIPSRIFIVSPPIGQPVTKILGLLSRCFPWWYSSNIFSVTASTSSGVVLKSNRYLDPLIIFWISVPKTGAGSSFITSHNSFRDLRISLLRCTAWWIISSVIITWKNSSKYSFVLMTSRLQNSSPFSDWLFGSSITNTGLNSAISSYIFFFPSQVVSPITRSAKWKNGHLSSIAKP